MVTSEGARDSVRHDHSFAPSGLAGSPPFTHSLRALFLRRFAAYDLAFYVGVFEGFVFQRNCHGAIEQEKGADAEFAAQADGEPDAVVLAAVVDGEADAGQVGAKESAHTEGHATGQFSEDVGSAGTPLASM